MSTLKMDHAGVVVEDLEAAKAFFAELGMELEGETQVEGEWVDRLNGMNATKADIAMMRTPDGFGLELTRYRSPAVIEGMPHPAPPNTLGLRNVMFQVEELDAMVARLQTLGAELLGEVVQYEDAYRLAYLHAPGGIIVALAEKLE